jgi:hypothetical protein
MPFIRRHWYDIGAIIAVGAVVWLVLGWQGMGVLQRLLLLNFIAILLHQYEEYGWPGGEPAIMNMVLQPSDAPDRYPLNQNSAMLVNVLITYGFYLVPVFFPKIIWLGLAPVLMGMLQFVVHGVVTNVKLKSIYNPGLAAVVFGHIPIGVFYIYFAHAQGLMSIWTWVAGIAFMVAVTYLTLPKMTYTWLADRDSPYAFAPVEMERFSVRKKLDRIRPIAANA